MSESRIFFANAAARVSSRLGVDGETAQSMLLAAVADKKLELIIDPECEREFRERCNEPVRHSLTRRTATGRPELDSAYAELAEATVQREIAHRLPTVCGQVGQAELSAWLDSLCAPELTEASEALIRDVVRAVYADRNYQLPIGKPPNINELVPIVQDRLAKDHRRHASWGKIHGVGNEAEFKASRRPIGRRLH